MVFVFLLFVSALGSSCLPENTQPVIGILTQPTDDNQKIYGDQYVVASYVKWIESAGARVQFVYYDAPQEDLKTLLTTQLNGLLFAGGDADIVDGQFADTARYLLSLVMQINLKADYFPLWATCQGFQQISIYMANDSSVLIKRPAENILMPLNFTEDATVSRVLSQAPDTVWAALTYENITINAHNYGVDPSSYVSNSFLYNNFSVLATNMDTTGHEFVSLVEGRSYPIYGSQFHPEKNAFEWDQAWNVDPNAHIDDAITTMQYFADVFVKEARKSQHNYTNGGLKSTGMLSMQSTPVYTGNLDPYWDQTYFFPNHQY